jgi:hypothetical protein
VRITCPPISKSPNPSLSLAVCIQPQEFPLSPHLYVLTYDSSSTTCSYVRTTRVPNFTCPTPILHHLHQTNAKQNRWHSRLFHNPKKKAALAPSRLAR